MTLKHQDDKAPHETEIERLLTSPTLTKAQREDLQEELWKIRAGSKGERDAAYLIDFHWKDNPNRFVLHDLRIEHGGRIAQIDHLILTRFLDCHVLETKGYSTAVRISERGEWEVKTRFGWRGMPSPVEQNRRHVEILKAFVRDNGLEPRRLGFPLPFTFHDWVLVAPECTISRKGGDFDRVVKMDMFEREYIKHIDAEGVAATLASAAKIVSSETVEKIAQALVRAHKPATFNFAGKFGIESPPTGAEPHTPPALPIASSLPVAPPPLPSSGQATPAQKHCQACNVILEAKVVDFCLGNSKKFGGRLLCQPCQKVKSRPTCDACNAELEDKVIAFCRFNSKKLGGKKLCRGCQMAVTSTR